MDGMGTDKDSGCCCCCDDNEDDGVDVEEEEEEGINGGKVGVEGTDGETDADPEAFVEFVDVGIEEDEADAEAEDEEDDGGMTEPEGMMPFI